MKEINIENNKFLTYEIEDVCFVFSTASNGLNFNKALDEGKKNLDNIRNWFDLVDVGYCSQTHSDIVNIFSPTIQDGDAIITNQKKIAVGVFTADCVPILLYDKGNKVVSAVHSGWRGTVKGIATKAIEKMILEYNSNPKNIIAFIGPHNRDCCYEVGPEVLKEFEDCKQFSNINYSKERYLNLAACIIEQLKNIGLEQDHIKDLDLCTYCSKEYKLHSYRKAKDGYGRMFSFAFIKN